MTPARFLTLKGSEKLHVPGPKRIRRIVLNLIHPFFAFALSSRIEPKCPSSFDLLRISIGGGKLSHSRDSLSSQEKWRTQKKEAQWPKRGNPYFVSSLLLFFDVSCISADVW